MVARVGVDRDPIEHLLDSLYRAAALVQVWGSMVADLDNKGEVEAEEVVGRIRGWTEWGEDRCAHDPLLVVTQSGKWKLHPFVEEYQRALERRAKFAKLALDAGVDERRTRIAENQAAQVAEIIRAVIAEQGLDEKRQAAAVRSAGRKLRLVS